MSHTAEDRDAVERHFATSILAMLADTPREAFGINGQQEVPCGTGGTDGQRAQAGLAAPIRAGSALTGERCLELFDAQLASRHLDVAARWLRAQGAGFYTIGSSGHEGNAAVAAALRPADPALVHYRSGADQVESARAVVQQGRVGAAQRGRDRRVPLVPG